MSDLLWFLLCYSLLLLPSCKWADKPQSLAFLNVGLFLVLTPMRIAPAKLDYSNNCSWFVAMTSWATWCTSMTCSWLLFKFSNLHRFSSILCNICAILSNTDSVQIVASTACPYRNRQCFFGILLFQWLKILFHCHCCCIDFLIYVSYSGISFRSTPCLHHCFYCPR